MLLLLLLLLLNCRCVYISIQLFLFYRTFPRSIERESEHPNGWISLCSYSEVEKPATITQLASKNVHAAMADAFGQNRARKMVVIDFALFETMAANTCTFSVEEVDEYVSSRVFFLAGNEPILCCFLEIVLENCTLKLWKERVFFAWHSELHQTYLKRCTMCLHKLLSAGPFLNKLIRNNHLHFRISLKQQGFNTLFKSKANGRGKRCKGS